MAPLIAILAAAAAKVGAPVIKSILSKHVGGLPGTLAGTVIDHIAERVGVEPENRTSLGRRYCSPFSRKTCSQVVSVLARILETKRAAGSSGGGLWELTCGVGGA